jgi:DNA-binding HxlR family transcriptional regulator
MNPHTGADCPMAQAIGIVGDRWSLILIREALDGATRYDDFKTRIGLSDNTLTRKRGELVESELLERTIESGRPTYRLTPAGEDLASVLAALGSWSQRWFPLRRPRKPPAAIAEAARSLGLRIG